MQKFKIVGKPLLRGKYVEGKNKKKERRIMPSLVATTSDSARTMFVCMHSAQTNIHQLDHVAKPVLSRECSRNEKSISAEKLLSGLRPGDGNPATFKRRPRNVQSRITR